MTTCKLILGLTSLFAGTAAAQVSVSIPAVVVDKSGQPVHSLQKSDFEVRSGKNVSFDSVEEVPPLKFIGFAEPVPVFILYDAVAMPVPDRGLVSQMLLDYLRKAADDHLAVTLLALSAEGIVVIHDMSTDSRVFAAAMDRVLPKPAQLQVAPTPSAAGDFSKAVDEEARQIGQLTKSMGILRPTGAESLTAPKLETLRRVGDMLQHSRKRKVLVWITGRFSVYVENGSLIWHYRYEPSAHSMELNGHGSEAIGALNSAYQAAVDSLNEARISMYPVSGVFENHDDAEETRVGLDELAKRTGGSLLPSNSTRDFASAVTDLCKRFDSYYILTLKTQPVHKSTWTDSSVKVNKADAEVTAAKGFFLIP